MSRQNKTYIFILAAILFFSGVESVQAVGGEAIASVAGSVLGGTFDLVGTVLSPLGWLLIKLTSYIAMLGGTALNASIYYTVIQMSEHFGSIPAISETWGIVRDIANMGFIFVLLYASIMTIVGKESPARGLIVKMVIAAVLINFSLFFTKVIIDISNLLALTFYKALVPAGELASGNFLKAGLSNTMISALKVNTLWETPGLDGANLFITAILSSIVLLITAFVFFAVAIMFVTRYIVLIFVLILSPIAFVSDILPGLSSTYKQWKDALSSQALFAPVYFLMTWITIKVITNISEVAFNGAGFGAAFTASGSETFDPSIAGTLVNFAIVIGAIIGSLIIAKSTAGKTASSLNKWMTNVAGGATLGMTGRLGRSTLGRAGAAIADNDRLKDAADKKGFGGAMARLTLATGRKTGSASFDARATDSFKKLSKETGTDFGNAIGKDGFQKILDDRRKEEIKTADSRKTTITSKKVTDDAIRLRKQEAQETYDEERARGVAGAKEKFKKAMEEARNTPVTDAEKDAARKAIGVRNTERIKRFADRMETPQSFQFQLNNKSGGPRYGMEAAEEIRKKFKQKSPGEQMIDIVKATMTPPPPPPTPPPAPGPTTP